MYKKMPKYAIEVVSIEGGTDIIGWHHAFRIDHAIKKAIDLSKRFNAKGITKQGYEGQQSVWIQWYTDDEVSHIQFIDGVEVYRMINQN
jgi:hypothetical protein